MSGTLQLDLFAPAKRVMPPEKDPLDMTDGEFMLWALRKHPQGLTTMELVRLSERVRGGLGLTCHSRKQDLRRWLEPHGETVECRIVGRSRHGKALYRYRIVELR